MKLGIIADVHCNHQALQTALDGMRDCDEILCAGDSVYQFRFSNEVMRLLRERGARYILGNHEATLLGKWGEHARSAEWVRQDEMAYMSEQPYQLETTVGGKKLVMVHGSPWEPHNEYIYPNSPAISRFAEIHADYVILGHTHYQMAERVGRALVINPGSAGEPRDPRNHFQLSYAILDTDTSDVAFTDFADPTRAAVDHAIIPDGTSGRVNSHRDERPARNTNFWRPG